VLPESRGALFGEICLYCAVVDRRRNMALLYYTCPYCGSCGEAGDFCFMDSLANVAKDDDDPFT
jgi:hypothetical protein